MTKCTTSTTQKEEWSGKKSSSCCLNTSTSSCCLPRSPMPWNLLIGLGTYLLLFFFFFSFFLTHIRKTTHVHQTHTHTHRRTKKKMVYVISTSHRPTPLEHYVFANGGMHKIVDAQRRFLSEGYRAAIQSGGEKSKTKNFGHQVRHSLFSTFHNVFLGGF